MLGLGATLVTGGAVILSYIKDSLKMYFNLTDNSPELLLDGGTEFSSSSDSDYISVADSDNDLDIAGDLTIAAWIKPTSGTHSFFIDKSESNSTRNYSLWMNSSQALRFDCLGGNLIGSTLTLGIWTHVAVTCDSGVSNGTKLHINGNVASGDTGTLTVTSNAHTLQFGKRYDDANYQYGGKMSSVGIWNRVLSESEIESIQWKNLYSELSGTELTNLRGWWDLQGDVEDKSGNDNDGTNNSTTLITNSYTGESPFKPRIQDIATPKMAVQLADGSTDFDGTNDYILVPDDTTLDFGTGDFTIGFWAYADDWTQANAGLVGLANASASAGVIIRLTSADKVETFISASGWGESSPLSASALTNGTWNHIVLARSSGTAKLYINGSLSDSDSNTADVPAYDVTIGRTYEDSDNYYFDGKIANVVIYKGTGLTKTQVQELMFTEKYSGLTSDLKTNLVSFYDMGSSSNPHNDLQGNNDGTNNGATVTTGYTSSPHGVADPLNFGHAFSGRALSFDGTNDTVITNNEITDFPFSVSSHFQTGSSFATGNIFSFTDASVINEYYGMLVDGSGNLSVIRRNTTEVVTDTGFDCTVSTWYHMVAVFGSATTATVYINGQSVYAGTGLTSVSIDGTFDKFLIGYLRVSTATYFWNGKISNVKVFNSVLTEAQIRELYTNPEQVLPTGLSSSNLKYDLPMQEGAGSYIYDGSGNQNHGTISGATWVTNESDGYQIGLVRSNTPMIFDGSDDYVSVGTPSALDINTFTISTWAKFDSITDETIVGEYLDGSNYSTLRIYSGKIYCYGFTGGNVWEANTSSAVIATGQWYHIVATCGTDTSTPIIYVDGSAVGLEGVNGSAIGTAQRLGHDETNIGRYPVASRWLNGIISELAIWDVAIDADAVTALYGSGTPLNVLSDSGNYDNSDDLVGYWKNDGNVTWTDRSSNSNNGTASGSPVSIVIPEGSTSDRDSQGFLLSDTTSVTNNGFRVFGKGEYIKVFDADMFHLGTDDYTFECWARFDDITSTRGLFSFFGDSSNRFHLTHYDTTLQFYSNVGGAALSASVTNTRDLDWHHYAVVKEDETLKIYLDGSVGVTNASWSQDIDYTGGWLAIGIRTDDGSDFTTYSAAGKIDEFKIYSKALSANEVTKNRNYGLSNHQ